ncbi:MAG: EF2563 family selenium-dependent molybdenum hydroxylase system protein [Deltaproteobacteria bacterium]|nr:EF2563 family selenium-dependent molybdenum hydroxylase system protein [Deltaproteobacteria bacterium]
MSNLNGLKVLIRGAGEIASGVAHRLHMARIKVAMTEIEHPIAVRREVSFCEAILDGQKEVEGVKGVKVSSIDEIKGAWDKGFIPVIIDPELKIRYELKPDVIVDGTIAKRNLGLTKDYAPLVIALGPGFEADVDCHMVIETNRGHNLGRIITKGSAEPNTGIPGNTAGYTVERVLRAPADGTFNTSHKIGDMVKAGDKIAEVKGEDVISQINGVLRGLIRNGINVHKGLKVGDVDPRGKREYCYTISDKARAVGGSVLEAILRVYG